MQPLLIYCYDAWCGWCYGFSPVIKKLSEVYKGKIGIEVLSGGMILNENPRPVGVMAGYIQQAYKTVESHTGIRFGQDFLWHIFNPDKSDWFPDSQKSAIALCIVKELQPDKQVAFASDLQYALNYEGRDLCDDEAYRHLLPEYGIDATDFYQKLHSEAYKQKAQYEFALVKQLQVTGFPAVLMQVSESKFYLVARGYTNYDDLSGRVEAILKDLSAQDNQ
jgi:putative protein-disulfide isomerase